MSYGGTLTISTAGAPANLPSAAPRLGMNMTITATAGNTAPVYVGAYGRVLAGLSALDLQALTIAPPFGRKLAPGDRVVIPTDDPSQHWLSGMPGDGVSYTGV